MSGVAAGALVAHVEHFQVRVIREALLDAEKATWERHAALLEWARPRARDFAGRATADELCERDARLAEDARACRSRAEVSLIRALAS